MGKICSLPQMAVGKLDIHKQKNISGPLSHPIEKKINSN